MVKGPILGFESTPDMVKEIGWDAIVLNQIVEFSPVRADEVPVRILYMNTTDSVLFTRVSFIELLIQVP